MSRVVMPLVANGMKVFFFLIFLVFLSATY